MNNDNTVKLDTKFKVNHSQAFLKSKENNHII